MDLTSEQRLEINAILESLPSSWDEGKAQELLLIAPRVPFRTDPNTTIRAGRNKKGIMGFVAGWGSVSVEEQASRPRIQQEEDGQVSRVGNYILWRQRIDIPGRCVLVFQHFRQPSNQVGLKEIEIAPTFFPSYEEKDLKPVQFVRVECVGAKRRPLKSLLALHDVYQLLGETTVIYKRELPPLENPRGLVGWLIFEDNFFRVAALLSSLSFWMCRGQGWIAFVIPLAIFVVSILGIGLFIHKFEEYEWTDDSWKGDFVARMIVNWAIFFGVGLGVATDEFVTAVFGTLGTYSLLALIRSIRSYHTYLRTHH